MRYSELTWEDLAVLRIEAALESAYPEVAERLGNRRASVILAGHRKWKSSRDHARSSGSEVVR